MRPVGHDRITAAYRSHAPARLRGDRAEARRLADRFGFERRPTHLVFTFRLFAQVVLDHFGDDLDRVALAAFTERLWKRHRGDIRFEPLRAEVLIRSIYGEREALTEIARAEQSGCLWAVMEVLVDPSSGRAEPDDRFEVAERLGHEWLAEIFVSPAFAPWRGDGPTPPEAPRSQASEAKRAEPEAAQEMGPRAASGAEGAGA